MNVADQLQQAIFVVACASVTSNLCIEQFHEIESYNYGVTANKAYGAKRNELAKPNWLLEICFVLNINFKTSYPKKKRRKA